MHLTRFFAEIWDFNTFVFPALQIRLQNLIFHKILTYFKKKFIKNATFFTILHHFSGLAPCTCCNTQHLKHPYLSHTEGHQNLSGSSKFELGSSKSERKKSDPDWRAADQLLELEIWSGSASVWFQPDDWRRGVLILLQYQELVFCKIGSTIWTTQTPYKDAKS